MVSFAIVDPDAVFFLLPLTFHSNYPETVSIIIDFFLLSLFFFITDFDSLSLNQYSSTEIVVAAAVSLKSLIFHLDLFTVNPNNQFCFSIYGRCFLSVNRALKHRLESI
ncbi:hypothetical protein GQ457_06G003170 [Hibiscus cannabinus]